MNKHILLVSACISVVFSAVISIAPIWIANQWEVSAMFPTLFTPATFTFSIWSIIYLSWIVIWAFYFFKWNFVKKENLLLLAYAQVLSSLWLIPSQYLYIGTSFIVMLGVLWLLWKLFLSSRDEEKYFRYTVNLFLGWILVASIANLHLMLVSFDLYFAPSFLTVSSLALAFVLNVLMLHFYKSFIPSIVFIWAAYGILAAQQDPFVILTAWGLSLWLITLLIKYYKEKHIEL